MQTPPGSKNKKTRSGRVLPPLSGGLQGQLGPGSRCSWPARECDELLSHFSVASRDDVATVPLQKIVLDSFDLSLRAAGSRRSATRICLYLSRLSRVPRRAPNTHISLTRLARAHLPHGHASAAVPRSLRRGSVERGHVGTERGRGLEEVEGQRDAKTRCMRCAARLPPVSSCGGRVSLFDRGRAAATAALHRIVLLLPRLILVVVQRNP